MLGPPRQARRSVVTVKHDTPTRLLSRRDTSEPVGRSTGRVLIVSYRLPVTLRMVDGAPTLARSAGGLASGLRSTHEKAGAWWLGYLGDTGALSAPDRASVATQLHAARASAIEINPADHRTFYSRLSNGVLWPLFHDRLDRLPLVLGGWDVYERVNARFADAIAAIWKPGDVVWIHDYHFMRLPALLRKRIPRARIGFFLHVPFPNPEIFLVLPRRRQLVKGMLGADVVGFHTRRYRGHFTAVVRRLFGLEMDADEHLRQRGRSTRLGIFPIGIDARDLSARAAAPAVVARAREGRPMRERLILGIDRLDYTKGIPRRMAAMERLLQRQPEWRGNVRLLQVAVPSRTTVASYRDFRRDLERLVTRINGRYATPAWMPIHYLYQSVTQEELLALYRAADVMLVTPLRDGMNLVAKEFIASRPDERGVLVLSEFAGAAAELEEAVLVNPYDVDGVGRALHQALTMDPMEQRDRMRALRARVFERDIHWWTREFLETLGVRSARERG